MTRLLVWSVLGLIASPSAGLGQAKLEVRRTEDVIYGRKFGMALTMDVFQPTPSNGCAILFLVNGGWLSSKDTPNMVTIQQAESFVARARSVGAPHADLIVRQGKGHGWGEFWRSAEDLKCFADWFDQHLRGIKR